MIAEIFDHAIEKLNVARTLDEVEAVRVEALGRKGKLANVAKSLGKLTPEERAQSGKRFNEAKRKLENMDRRA